MPLLLLVPSLLFAAFGGANSSSGPRPSGAASAANDAVGLRLGPLAPSFPDPGSSSSGTAAPTSPSTAASAAPSAKAGDLWYPTPAAVQTLVPGGWMPTPPATGPVAPLPTQRPTAAPTPQPPAPTPVPVPPQPPAGTSLALGVWSGQPWNPSALDAVTSLLGRAPAIFLTYEGWDRTFHSSDEAEIARRGAAHVLTWEPNGYSLKTIASGGADAFIRAWAQGAAAWGGRIYLRPMHEMNGDWYPWGRGVNGNTPSDFIGAWRRMHDIFVAAGATNVKWVWSPNVRYGTNYPLADLYPGSSYVDWLGLDGYNWGLDKHLGQPKWQSFGEIFGATYREVVSLAPGKPLMIAETASTENGGNKAQWILQTYLADVPDYPVVRAVIWFNQADGASDFRINSSAASLAAFKQVVNSAAYKGHLP